MPSIELVDKIDQQHRGRYYRGASSSSANTDGPSGAGSPNGGPRGSPNAKNAGTKSEDLIFTVEDGTFTTPTNGTPDTVSEDYVGLEQELEFRLARRRRNRIVAVCALVGAFMMGLAVHRRRGGNVAPSNASGSGSSSGGHTPTSGGSNPAPSPAGTTTDTTVEEGMDEIDALASLWPTASPQPAFDICPPPIKPDKDHGQRNLNKHKSTTKSKSLPIFHMGELRTVPEAPTAEDDDEQWEYSFSSMDISDDASIIAVGLEDFSAGTDYAVGMVRTFAYSCLEQKYVQLGQDLRGTNDYEQFGHRISSSGDGKVMAVSAPQESYEGGNGFVVVYFLNEAANRWDRLGPRIDNLDSVKDYDRLGHAVDLSDRGETLAVLGITDANSYVVRVFEFDYNSKKWNRKGRDLKVTVNYADDYDYAPQLSLSEAGDELSISDPEFGVVRYHFHFAMNKWERQDAKSVAFDDEDYWIDAVDADDDGNVIAFAAFETQDDENQADYWTVKVVDFANGTAEEVYTDHYEDYAVGVSVAVADNGHVAAVVASKMNVNDDEFWSQWEYVGAMTIVSNAATKKGAGKWEIVGEDTEVEGMGVPGNFVTLSGDGRIAAVGSDNVVALYGIVLEGDLEPPAAGDASDAGDAGDGSSGTDQDSDSDSSTTTTTTFEICPPFPDAAEAGHVGDIDTLPKQPDQHTLSLAMSSDGSIVAVGIDSYDGEDRGMARVFAWSCDSKSYVQLGQDLLGTEEFDGFGQSVALSADGRTLVVGANQPPPGKSGYVEVYSYDGDGDGKWALVGHRVDNVENTVGDVGREVRISDDGTVVAFSGSIMVEEDGYAYDSSFVRAVQNVNGEWKAKGDDLIGSIGYDEYGSEVHISQSGDGRTLGIAGSYSAFMAKIYTFDDDKKNWTEHIIPPIKDSEDDDDDDDMYSWDEYYDNYFSGNDIDLSDDGTFVAIAGIKYTDTDEDAVIRVLKKDPTSGNWTLSHDPVDFADEYEANNIAISADGTTVAVGINAHTEEDGSLEDQGALFVATMDAWDEGWNSTDKVDGRAGGDMLGSRVAITRDGTLAAASSRKGYVSFFKTG